MKLNTIALAALACSLTGCVLSSKTSTQTASLNYQQVTKRFTPDKPMAPDSIAGVGVICPKGFVVSGGGFEIDSTALAVESSGPSSNTDFAVYVRNISDADLVPEFEVTAICIRLT